MERLMAQVSGMRAREVDDSSRSGMEEELGALWGERLIWLVGRQKGILHKCSEKKVGG